MKTIVTSSLKYIGRSVALFLVASVLLIGLAFIFSQLVASDLITSSGLERVASAIKKLAPLFVLAQMAAGTLLFAFWYEVLEVAIAQGWVRKMTKDELFKMRWGFFTIFISLITLFLFA